ncbi:MAG TPA: hypothetical protein VH186_01570 [Chloroflexia bacterium]|nr:hypothetical protein [Chloroflexia bacterium]
MSLTRLVIKEHFPQGRLNMFEVRQHWYFVKFSGTASSRQAIKQLETRDEQVTIFEVNDLELEARFFVIKGDPIEPVVEAIRSGVEVYSSSEIENMLRAVEEETDPQRVVRVGLASPRSYDPFYFSFLESALASKDRHVCQKAVLVCQVVGWPELKPLLQTVQATSLDPQLQALTQQALANFGQFRL